MKINCLSCGFGIRLDDAYSDYEGQIKCYACSALLEIKMQDSNVKSVKFIRLTNKSDNKSDESDNT